MKSQTHWYKEFWPWFIITLLLSVVIACIATIRLAIKYDDAPAQGSYQKQGLGIVANNVAVNKVVVKNGTTEPVSPPAQRAELGSSDVEAPVQ